MMFLWIVTGVYDRLRNFHGMDAGHESIAVPTVFRARAQTSSGNTTIIIRWLDLVVVTNVEKLTGFENALELRKSSCLSFKTMVE